MNWKAIVCTILLIVTVITAFVLISNIKPTELVTSHIPTVADVLLSCIGVYQIIKWIGCFYNWMKRS